LQLAGVQLKEEIHLCGGGLRPAAETQVVRQRLVRFHLQGGTMRTRLEKRAPAVALLLAACSTQASRVDASADRAAIAATAEAYAHALEIGLPDTVMRYWTDDALYINIGIPTLRSRAAFDSVFALVHSAWHDVKASITTDEIAVDHDLAYQIGFYSETFHLAAGVSQQLQGRELTAAAPQEVGGRFMFIWRRQPDGSWKIARAIGTDAGK